MCIPEPPLLYIRFNPYLLKRAKMHVYFMGFVNFIWSIVF